MVVKVITHLLHPGAANEYWVAIAIEYDNYNKTIAIATPLSFKEKEDNSYTERVKSRLLNWQEIKDCSCSPVAMCYVHDFMQSKWDVEDADAIDSWLETKDDINAMVRRAERQITSENKKDNTEYWR